jgi:hypothetical protein
MTTWSTWAAAKAHVVDLLAAVPDLASYVLEGVPSANAEDVLGPDGSGVTIFVDNANVEITVDQRALGVAKIAESYRLVVVVQVVARDSGPGVREAEARVVELASAVMNVVYGSSTGYDLAVGLSGWTVRARFDGLTFQSGPMEHGGYSALGFVGVQIDGTRC